jgi:molybdopterin converting factor small subunit
LRSHVDGRPSVEVDVRPGQTVEQMLTDLGVPPGQARIIYVNDRAATLAYPLQGGERVGVFPPVGGG